MTITGRPYDSTVHMSKRGSRLTRPVATDEWELVAITTEAARGWAQMEASEPNALARAYDQLTQDPLHHSSRQHRLKGNYATGTYQGRTFDRWQYEVSGAGRIWYFVDAPDPLVARSGKRPRPRKRVLVEMVSAGHPKGTE